MAHTYNGATRLHFETFGEGEPLVLIMGLGGSIQAWGLQVAGLSASFRLVTPDNRGVGGSDKPLGPYDMDQFAEDLACVMNAAGVDSAHVLGVSMGGLIAQAFYHRYPTRVRSLILGCTGVGPSDPAAVPASPDVWDALRLDRGREPVRRIVEAMVEVFYHPGYRERVPVLVDQLVKIAQATPQPPHAYEAQLQACLNHPPFSPRLGHIDVPALVLHGADDLVWPVANAHYLAEYIPNSRLHVIPAAGHMFMVEQPRLFNKAVTDFITSIGDGATT